MKWLIPAAVAAVLVGGPANAAITIVDNSPGVSPYVGAFTYDFDTPGTTPVFDAGAVESSTVSGLYAQPYGSVGSYFSAGPSTGEPATLQIAASGASAVTLLWGSIDTYNTLSFVDAAGNTLGSAFTGTDVTPSANGDQGDPATNRIVTFGFTGTDASNVRGLRLTSNGTNAFEIDSITVAAIPEPATWAMMVGGFGLLGAAARRRRASTAIYYA